MRFKLEGENRAAGTGTGDSSTIEDASEVRWHVNAATGTYYTITCLLYTSDAADE